MQLRYLALLVTTAALLSACGAGGESQRTERRYPTINGVRQLTGDEASALISGKSVVGYFETSSGSYVDFFAADGGFASSAFDTDIHHGNWIIVSDRVCIRLADETPPPNRCITFIATNDQYVAFRPGGKGIFRITGIRSGNFKNLPLE